MSTPEAPRKAAETKQVPSTSTTSRPPQASTSATATAAGASTSPPNGTANGIKGDTTAANRTGASAGQGIVAALASTEPPGAQDSKGNKDRSNQIDRQLEDDQKKFRKECKILLLGEYSFLWRRSVLTGL